MKAEMLAARTNCLRNILRLGSRHHEDDMPRWLLQRLQQRVGVCVGDLVRLVKDVNLETIACGTITRSLAELADLVDTAVGGCVNLNHVHGIAGPNFATGIANT